MNREDRAKLWSRVVEVTRVEIRYERLRRSKKILESIYGDSEGEDNDDLRKTYHAIENALISCGTDKQRLWTEIRADFVDMDMNAEVIHSSDYDDGETDPYEIPWYSFLVKQREKREESERKDTP